MASTLIPANTDSAVPKNRTWVRFTRVSSTENTATDSQTGTCGHQKLR